MVDAKARGWGEGWPKDRRRDMTRVRSGDVEVMIHREIAPIVAWLMAETEARGYRLRRGECWGYANRAIKGTRTASNHSWGLAVDLNAPANPWGDKLITDMPPWMPPLWRAWGFSWGGAYRGRKDAMHYEFLGSPDTARELVARLRNNQAIPRPAAVHFTDYAAGEDEMRRYDIQIALDDQGRGHLPSPLDVPADRVVSLVAHGPYPPDDGYWNTPVVGRQARDNGTMVTATEGPPNGTVLIAVWVLG
jgi:hypothetical protein